MTNDYDLTADHEASMKSPAVSYLWHSNFDGLSYDRDMLRRSLIVISGPSGAGKSAVATTLCKIDLTYLILRNYTTRAPRLTDYPGHFGYLSEQGFIEAHAEEQFFLARLEPDPRYGYKGGDLAAALVTGMHPLLMFRHAGTKYLAESLGGIPTVFIEGDPKEIAKHSRNILSPPTDQDVKNTLVANRHLQELMARENWPWFRVTNHYGGKSELHAIAQQINKFLHTRMDIAAIHQRERSLVEPRYGISLVAGRPFSQNVLHALEDIQSQLTVVAQASLLAPDQKSLHLTVLRGRSSLTPCVSVSAPPPEVAMALEGVGPVTIAWSEITLDPDGAIRAYALPRTWPFFSHDRAHVAAKALSRIFGVHVSLQPRLYVTLGMIGAAACGLDTPNKVRAVLSRCLLPKTTIAQLRLVYYRDLYMNDADTLETYDLR